MALFLFLTLLGLALLVVETFLPGAIAGILGLLCLGAGIAFAFVEFGFEVGFIILLVELFFGMIGFYFWVKYFPKSRLGRIWSLTEEPPEQVSFKGRKDQYNDLLGKEGTAITMLRPAGTASITGKRYDVVSENGLIPDQSHVKVVKVEGSVIVVRKI